MLQVADWPGVDLVDIAAMFDEPEVAGQRSNSLGGTNSLARSSSAARKHGLSRPPVAENAASNNKHVPPAATISKATNAQAGRRKIQIQKIENDRARAVTFSKRKNGLLKKAQELAVLCDVELSVMIFTKKGKLVEYSSAPQAELLERYANFTGPREKRTMGPADKSKAHSRITQMKHDEPKAARAAASAAVRSHQLDAMDTQTTRKHSRAEHASKRVPGKQAAVAVAPKREHVSVGSPNDPENFPFNDDSLGRLEASLLAQAPKTKSFVNAEQAQPRPSESRPAAPADWSYDAANSYHRDELQSLQTLLADDGPSLTRLETLMCDSLTSIE